VPVPSSIKKEKEEVSQNNINDIYMGVFGPFMEKFYTYISNPEILCVMDTLVV